MSDPFTVRYGKRGIRHIPSGRVRMRADFTGGHTTWYPAVITTCGVTTNIPADAQPAHNGPTCHNCQRIRNGEV